MAVAPTPVAAAPDAPDRAQRATFSARATAFFDWIKNTFVAGVNALASNVYANAQDAASSAANAVAQSASATAQAGIATAQAAAATSAAATATTQAGVATTQAASITTAAATSTEKAAVATAKAAEATAAAATATAVTLGVATGYPIIRPSLTLDFANSQIFDPRITFTRASAATRVNSMGLIETVASGVPRLTYNAVTGACEGYLVEEQRTNLLTYSEQFDNAAWVKVQGTVSANVIAAPDGTFTADKFIEDASALEHFPYQNCTVTSGTSYTVSFFIKSGGRTKARIQMSALGFGTYTQINADFDLSTGVVIRQGSSVTGATIQAFASGWYRCTMTLPATATTTSAVCLLPLEGTSSAYTGDGTSGLYIWGAQLEAGAFPTSYIPTTASQVTRAADLAVMTGTNFSNWFRADEGTFVVDYRCDHIGGQWFPSAWYVDSGSSNRFGHAILSTNKSVTYDSLTAGVPTAYLVYANSADDVKSAFAYRQNDMAASTFGAAVVSDTSTTVPSVNAMNIGGRMSEAQLNGHIRSLRYFPRRLTNAELQTLTQD